MKTGKHFGDLAVGIRLSTPEPLFITSLIDLIVNGLRENDLILTPAHDLPAHKAANKLAREFLTQTEADTLLLLDDDMIFLADAAERLRTNKNNWPYDIVTALATTRSLPPKPIIMKLLPTQPGQPWCKQGEIYEHHFEYQDNTTEPVDSSGLAFTLIRRCVLKRMTTGDPQYNYYFAYGNGLESEDIPFYRRARELGLAAAVDTGVPIKHITHIALGAEEFQRWRKNNTLDLDRERNQLR